MQPQIDLRCPLCSGTSGHPERRLDGYNLFKCCTCALVYVWPRPTRIASHESYTRGTPGAPLVDTAADSVQLMRAYDQEHDAYTQHALGLRLLRIARHRSVRRMLDFGCGSGHLLGLAKRVLGCETHGVELHPVAELGAARFGFELHRGPLEAAPFAPGSFDLVYTTQVFEHLAEPERELQMLRSLLAPRGCLFIEVPNYNSLSIRLGRDRFVSNRPPGHLNYFTPATLRRLLEAAGLAVVSQRTTGLDYRALLHREAPKPQAATSGCLRPPGRQIRTHGLLKLRLLALLDGLLSVPGWGIQNEVLAHLPAPER